MGGKQSGQDPVARNDAVENLPDGFRVREDGAICWGLDCLVIKPEGKDLRITVDGSKCGSAALAAYGDLIEKTIGKGGKTVYEVPAVIKRED